MLSFYQPIISFLSSVLTFFHTVTGDWGAAIILLTLAVKAALYRFNLTAARQMLRSSAMQPALSELRAKHEGKPERMAEETMKLYRLHGVKPLAGFSGLLVQMPVLASMYRLFQTHGSMMSSHLVPWIGHLADADPYRILPVAAAVLAFASAIIPLAALPGAVGTAGTSGFRKKAGLAGFLALLPLLVTWHAPAALGIYWMTGTVFGLLERGFYRTQAGRRLLAKGLLVPAPAAAG